jgi:predicted kinase
MCGPPCSGKTTSATALADELNAVRLAPDEWIATLGLDLRTPLRDNVDLLQWAVAQKIVLCGGTAIIESGHWMKSERDEKRLWARAVGARVELRYLNVPTEVLLARARERSIAGGWAKYPLSDEELLGWLSYFEPPLEDEQQLFDAGEPAV